MAEPTGRYIRAVKMPESTGVDCIDKLVQSIVSTVWVELTRNVKLREEDSSDKRYIGEGLSKYICEVFEYQNGRGKKGRLGVGYQSTDGISQKCELYLLDVRPNDVRVKACFKENQSIIKPPKALPEMEGAVKLSLERGDIYNAYKLCFMGRMCIEISFKTRRSNLVLMEGTRNLPTWANSWTEFYTIPNVQNGLNYSEKEFIQYIMTSNARR